MKKKYLLRFLIRIVLEYPILFGAIWLLDIRNYSFNELAKEWYWVLIVDLFVSALYYFFE